LQSAQLSQNWAQLSKEEKKPYELKASKDYKRYKLDMVKYEKKMAECEEEMYDKAMSIEEDGNMKPASKPKSSKSGKKNKKAPSHDAALEESAARSAKAKRSRDSRDNRAKKRLDRFTTSGTSSELVPAIGGGASEVASMVPSLPDIGGGGGKPSAKATVMAADLPTSSAGGSGGSSTAALSLAVTRSDSSLDAQQGTSDTANTDETGVLEI